jgi:hypothetical protein
MKTNLYDALRYKTHRAEFLPCGAISFNRSDVRGTIAQSVVPSS